MKNFKKLSMYDENIETTASDSTEPLLSSDSVDSSSLEEAILIIENLMTYGKIHTVKGVRYVEGSHEEIIEKAEIWLNKVRKNYH